MKIQAKFSLRIRQKSSGIFTKLYAQRFPKALPTFSTRQWRSRPLRVHFETFLFVWWIRNSRNRAVWRPCVNRRCQHRTIVAQTDQTFFREEPYFWPFNIYHSGIYFSSDCIYYARNEFSCNKKKRNGTRLSWPTMPPNDFPLHRQGSQRKMALRDS